MDQITSLVDNVVDHIDKIVELQRAIEPTLDKTLEDSKTAEGSLEEVFVKLKDTVDMIASISKTNQSQGEGIRKLVGLADEVHEHFEKQIELAESTYAATTEFNAASQEISAKSAALSEAAKGLDDIVKNFKL